MNQSSIPNELIIHFLTHILNTTAGIDNARNALVTAICQCCLESVRLADRDKVASVMGGESLILSRRRCLTP
jgi:hypothetical protein